MNVRKTLLGACAVLALAAAAAVADPGQGMKHGMKHGEMMEKMEAHLAEALALNAEQKAALRQLHEELKAKMEPLMEQQHRQHEELKALLESASPDPAEVGNKAIAAHAAHAQLKALHEDCLARFSALLNEEQKAKLAEIHKQHGLGGHHFPGSGHGPGH